MLPAQSGSLPLFRFRGIAVSVHWSWFLVALYELQTRHGLYRSPVWNVYEYLALFGIVLLHEFGHSLACRQTGGQADTIVLWPLGGVAFVNPPQRAGAQLWSIAAGPLVNVALLPLFAGLNALAESGHWRDTAPDFVRFLGEVAWINRGLLIFNILPIYPLDGGQILRSLLWFPFGRARSLLVATSLGFLGVAYLGWQAVQQGSLWFGVLAYFMGTQCLNGFRYARALARSGVE
jgi:Zn-dependent protease